MIAFAFYLLKLIVCSGILFLYYLVALRNKAFHQWNRFYLLLSVVVSVLLPLLQFTVTVDGNNKDETLHFLQRLPSVNEYLEEFVIVSGKKSSPDAWMALLYSLVCLFFFVLFLVSLYRVWTIIRSHQVQTMQGIKFVNTDVPGTPFSFFSYIFWNDSISLHSDAGQKIFQHELVHVHEKHSADKLFLQLVTSLFWCNPFFWLIRKELHFVHEFIADKKSVGETGSAGLAAMILQTTYPKQFNSLVNPFFQTSIKRRIAMLTGNQRVNYVGRIIALPVIATVALAFTVRTKANEGKNLKSQLLQPKESTDTLPRKTKEIGDMDVNTVKKTMTLHYSDGTTETLTLDQARKRGLLGKEKTSTAGNSRLQKPNEPKPLYMVDGQKFNGDLNTIDPMKIESIDVLKEEDAIDKYGEKGKNGAIEIKLKDEPSSRTAGTEPVFEQTEMPASVDKNEWRAHLEKTVQPIIENGAKKGMKPGTYTVNVRFLVNQDGSISRVVALNEPGYGIAEKVVNLVRMGPKWKPAKQNGKPVASYHTQPITFVIQEQ